MTTKSRSTSPRRGRGAATQGARRAMPDLRRPVITGAGREALVERVERIRNEVLPELRPLLVENDRDERVVAEFERTQAELDSLEALLAEAGSITVGDDVRDEVGLGAVVTVEMPGGDVERVRLVHPVEAFLDDERISATSPLAQALHGARVGETVMVSAPTGAWPATVTGIEWDGAVDQSRPA